MVWARQTKYYLKNSKVEHLFDKYLFSAHYVTGSVKESMAGSQFHGPQVLMEVSYVIKE